MSIISTPLSTILNRMNRYKFAADVEEQYKVYDLDEAIRRTQRNTTLPWCIKKSTLKIFSDVNIYPVASDQDCLIYLDSKKANSFATSARFKYTSLQQFFEDVDNRNNLAEIWDGGVKFLGVKYNNDNSSSLLVTDTNSSDNFTVSGDATEVSEDNINYTEGNGSVKVTIVSDTGIANVINTCAVSDVNYKKKYYFRKVYLSAVPTSIELRFGIDSSNYLSSGSLTTQFSGQPLKANDWNLLAFDLNNATTVGTIDAVNNQFTYEDIKFNDAESGVYNIENSYLREWSLLDYWYVSKNLITTSGSSDLLKESFVDNEGSYDITDVLVGDKEWADIIMFDALEATAIDAENKTLINFMSNKKAEAWSALEDKYPDMQPLIITNRYRFGFNSN